MVRIFGVLLAVGWALSWPVLDVKADLFGSGANLFEIEFVTIGSAGNPPDTTGLPAIAGSVSYVYGIGKYEISEQMIDKANNLGGLGITKDARGPNKPATSISWREAAQFVNWLNASTGNHAAYKFDAGGNFQLWQPSDPGYVPGALLRNSLAKYVLASVDEWYKAAYYNPTTGLYVDYPTGSDSAPIPAVGGTLPGTAIYFAGGPANVTEAGGLSPFRTMAQGGNVAEWNETVLDTSGHFPNTGGRAVRGGDWGQYAFDMSSSQGSIAIPTAIYGNVGFRVVAVIPEPATAFLVFLGVSGFLTFAYPRAFGRSRYYVEHSQNLEALVHSPRR